MNVTPLFDSQFIKLRAFVLAVVPAGTQCVKGNENRVPQPLGDHVVITSLFERRLRTNVSTYDDDGSSGGFRNVEQGTEVHFQFDSYGPTAADNAARLSTLFRDEYGVAALAPTLSPLYIDDGRIIPLVSGEEQYVRRVSQTAVCQYNPVVSVPQQFADAADVALVDAETIPTS